MKPSKITRHTVLFIYECYLKSLSILDLSSVEPRVYRAAYGSDKTCAMHIDIEILIVAKKTVPFVFVLANFRWIYTNMLSHAHCNCVTKCSQLGGDQSTMHPRERKCPGDEAIFFL